MDKFKEECGVFGIFGHPEAANMTYLGLYALQHRGQESAGIAASDGEQIRVSRAMGYVADAFDGESLARLPGPSGIPPPARAGSRMPSRSSSTAPTDRSPSATTATW
jgi:glutamine phosphoribosylpyrophosphate amidotransferase